MDSPNFHPAKKTLPFSRKFAKMSLSILAESWGPSFCVLPLGENTKTFVSMDRDFQGKILSGRREEKI